MRALQYFFMSLAALFMAVPAFAQTAGASSASTWVPIGAGIGMGIASGFCGVGEGLAAASACEAYARNPAARAGIQMLLILGLAFIESLALFTLVIVFVVVR